MRRREFIAIAGAACIGRALPAHADSAPPVVGFLHSASLPANAHLAAIFRQGLGETGYEEGRNVAIEYRWAEDQFERLPGLASDLVGRRVAAIFAGALPAAVATKAATATTPIIFFIGSDPVTAGLVANINRPGGNLTGVTTYSGELMGKRLEMLRELVPAATVIAVLINPNNPNADDRTRAVRDAGQSVNQQIRFLTAARERDLPGAFETAVRQQAGAILIGDDALFTSYRRTLTDLAAARGLPAMYFQRDFVAGGGLISYAADYREIYRQAGIYTGRVLKGASPADLPILQPSKFELVINLRAAKTLGLTVPPALLARADEVIE